MFDKKSPPVGKIRVTTTRTIDTDMTVLREFFQLLADAPPNVVKFITDVEAAIAKLNDFQPGADDAS